MALLVDSLDWPLALAFGFGGSGISRVHLHGTLPHRDDGLHRVTLLVDDGLNGVTLRVSLINGALLLTLIVRLEIFLGDSDTGDGQSQLVSRFEASLTRHAHRHSD